MEPTKKTSKKTTTGYAAVSAALMGLAGASAAALLPVAPACAQTQAPTNIVAAAKAFDVFVGQNKTGPYELSWKKILADGVVIVVDGATLAPANYAVDAEKGIITFKNSLRQGVVVRVDYTYDNGVATRNTNPASVPITVPLLRVGGQSVQVTALPPPAGGDAGKPGAATKPNLVVGLAGKNSFLGGGLTSQMYLAPGMSGFDGGTYLDRAALRLNYKVGDDNSGINAQFSRAGREFAPSTGKLFEMADPSQQWSFGAQRRLTSWLGAEYLMTEARDLTGKGASEMNRLGVRLGGVNGIPALNFARVEDTKTDAEDAATTVTTDKVDLAAKLGGAAQVSAKGQIVATNAPDDQKNQTAKEGTVAVSAANKNKTAQASVAVSTGTKETATAVEQKQGVEIKLQPAPALIVSAEQKQQTVTPTLTGDPARDEAALTKETTTQTAKAEVTPLKGTSLTGAFQMRDEGDKKISATDVNAELGKGAFLNVAGGITDRKTTDDKASVLDTTRARVALRPLSGLTFSGGLTINPADDKGNVSEATRQEFGLAAKLGFLELGGGYAITTPDGGDSANPDPQAGELSLTLGMRFSRWTRLDGNYKDNFLYGSDTPAGLRVYSVGLTHDLGSALNFSLGGKMTEDKTQIGKPADVTAEAKFGVKF